MNMRLILALASFSTISVESVTSLGTAPRRPVVDGAQVLDPDSGKPLLLRGFNWYLPIVSDNDGDLQKQLVPGSTVVRIVGIFWDNYLDDSVRDCRTDDAETGYIKQTCIDDLEKVVRTATNAGLWAILTGRAEYAAGQSASSPNVFQNKTLRDQYLAMWKYVANHFKTFDRIAAYEIMSEPRVKDVPDENVTLFMADGCKKVHQVDPATPCMVGPAPYYKPWKLNDDSFIDQPNIIYTFDYFFPDVFCQESDGGTHSYPSSMSCDVVFKGWTQIFCPTDRSQVFDVNKDLLESVLVNYPLAFSRRYNVPVLNNQFGVKRGAGDDNGRARYMKDLLDVFAKHSVHSIYWVWRMHGWSWEGFEVVHGWSNGTESVDTETVGIFSASWSSQAQRETTSKDRAVVI